jgi:cation transport protein ChaC
MTAADRDTLAPQEASMARQLISRSSLQDGSFLERARAIPGLAVRSDGELEASLDETLAARPTDAPIWLFGYGSLMWNPAFSYVERRNGTLRGWHRRFCLWMRLGRGTPERPGLMLALDRGGTTLGVAFRLARGEERAELLLVWRREMFTGAYHARWVILATDEGPVHAIALVVNREHNQYVARIDEGEAVEHIATAQGPLGSSAEYLFETVAHLQELGLRDHGLERVRRSLVKRLRFGHKVRSTASHGKQAVNRR